MNEKNIVLIGFMGTGKTTIGSALSKRLQRTFIDTDSLIQERYQMSIFEMFKKHGEVGFRNRETETIKDISEEEHTVISTGGGVVLKEENINYLRRNGVLYLLDGDIETIVSNLKTNTSNRPLLNSNDWIQTIKELIGFRKELYINSADYIINIDNKPIGDIIDEILKLHGCT